MILKINCFIYKQPAIIGLLAFFVGLLLFLGFYSSYDYLKYLSDFQFYQNEKNENIKSNKQDILRNLKELISLTQFRIQNLKVPPDKYIKSVQKILISTSQLHSFRNLPDIQRIVYVQFLPTPWEINRFDDFPITHQKSIFYKADLPSRNIYIEQNENRVFGKTSIYNSSGIIEGFLEIQLNAASVEHFAKFSRDISVNNLFYAPLLNVDKIDFSVYNGISTNYLSFIVSRRWPYIIISLFILLALIFPVCFLYYLVNDYRQKQQVALRHLEEQWAEAKFKNKQLKDEFLTYQSDMGTRQLCYQAQQAFYAKLRERQKEEMYQVLKVLGTFPQFTDKDQLARLKFCKDQTKYLSNGLWTARQQENICLKTAIDNLQLFFAEKILKSTITIKVNYHSKNFAIEGDLLLVNLLLINAIGKTLFRVPDKGTVDISIKESSNFFMIEIQDNGFSGVNMAEKFIRQSCDLFITDELFQKICNDSGLLHKRSSNSQGLNTAYFIFPVFNKKKKTCKLEKSPNNVIKLFS